MKNWLDSADYTELFLSELCRKTPAGTHDFGILFPDDEIGLERLPAFAPFGRPGRCLWNLAPYWRSLPPMPPHRSKAMTLSDFMNEPLRSSIHAARLPEGTVFRFQHALFDGVGAEALLSAMRPDRDLPEVKGLEKPHLDDWKRQFESGRAFMAHLVKLRADGPIARSNIVSSARNLFRIQTLTEAETERIDAESGGFFLVPHLLAAFSRGFSSLAGEGQIIVPMTVDLRDFEEELAGAGPYFNRWAVVPLQTAKSGEDSDIVSRKSFIEAAASHLPQAVRHASFLIRIAPFFFMKRFLRSMTEILYGSFLFSYLPSRFHNAIHLPAVPPRPGVGVFVTRCGGRLRFALSYREGVFPECDLFRWFDETVQLWRTSR